MEKHISVLLNESISKLDVKSDGIYIDATLGRAGHSKEIFKNIKTGKLYCFDKDQEAIDGSTKVLKSINDNFEIIHSDFSKIGTFNEELIGNVDGILFDLGVSSPQLDKQERGFSYHNDGPLDMRMNKEDKLTAYEVVNEYSLDKLAKVFRDYGEDRFSWKVAKQIVEVRETKEIKTTLELVEIIKDAKPHSAKVKKHPAKQIFQAIRIEVNDELNAIKVAIKDSLKLLKVNGKLVVITFHSLEDKIVKEIFHEAKKEKTETVFEIKHKYRTNKTIYPTDVELKDNRRSKSARLRTITRSY